MVGHTILHYRYPGTAGSGGMGVENVLRPRICAWAAA